MRRFLYVVLALGLLPLAAAQESMIVTQAEPLRFAFATELLGYQLEALTLGGELEEEEAEEEAEEEEEEAEGEDANEVEVDPFELFAGTLEAREPELYEELEAALAEVEAASEAGDQAELEAAVARAQELLAQARAVLVPAELAADPAFQAAVLARLALSGSGFAEGYEEAAEGEVGAYVFGWAGLQRAKALWAELEPSVENEASAAEVERVFAVLDELMAAPEPPARFRDPEDAEVAAHDLVFALETALAQPIQPRDLGAVLALAEEQAAAACQAVERNQSRLGLELALAAQVTYVESVAGTLAMLAPEPSEALRELLGQALPEQIETGDTAALRQTCGGLSEAFAEAGAVFP